MYVVTTFFNASRTDYIVVGPFAAAEEARAEIRLQKALYAAAVAIESAHIICPNEGDSKTRWQRIKEWLAQPY